MYGRGEPVSVVNYSGNGIDIAPGHLLIFTAWAPSGSIKLEQTKVEATLDGSRTTHSIISSTDMGDIIGDRVVLRLGRIVTRRGITNISYHDDLILNNITATGFAFEVIET